MKRLPHIRFFVSSTFMDMKVERDILQEVFERLKPEYAARGWVVEYVDLRWGISPESTDDNRTIQICLEELRRCQEVSPRPNFIILSGERRGWIPIPEVIDSGSYEWLRGKCNALEIELIERWYEGDFNAYPDPVYNLRSKTAYGPTSIFDAELPSLEALFKRTGYDKYGSSATELEIKHGVFLGENDKVMGYIRTLTNIPREYKHIYTSESLSDWWELKRVHRHLKKAIDPANLITHKIDYRELESKAYHDMLAGEFEQCIRALIDQEISRNTVTNTLADEQLIHEAFARDESARLIGREQEQTHIRNYVEESDYTDPLWYVGSSGQGKTALLARAAAMYLDRDDYNVIAIFCGLTPLTSTVNGLFQYLHYRLVEIAGDKINITHTLSQMMYEAAREKRLVIIIDSLDRLDYGKSDKIDILKKLPSTSDLHFSYYKNNMDITRLRVIFSTVDTYEWYYAPTVDYDRTTLYSIEDRPDFLKRLLYTQGRTLTSLQYRLANEAARQSDGRAVYLSLLVKCCAQLESSDKPINFPVDFTLLMRLYIDTIIDIRNYDGRMVRLALALIACSNGGLRHDDMPRLLAMDTDVWIKFHGETSHALVHKIGDSWRLPPIVWTRLYYDLRPLLRTSHTPTVGETFDFLHPTLAQAVMEYAGREIVIAAVKYLCNLLGSLWPQKDPLALDRIISVTLEREDLPSKVRGLVARGIFMNPDFFIRRYLSREGALESDSERIAKIMWPTDGPTEIADELQNFPAEDETLLRHRIMNLYDSARSKQCLQASQKIPANLLSDALRNYSLATSIVARPGKLARPSMTREGVSGLRNGLSEWWCYDYDKGKYMIRGCSQHSISGSTHVEGSFSFDENGELVEDFRTSVNLEGVMTDTPARRNDKYLAYCTGFTGQGFEIEVALRETGDVVMSYHELQEPPQWMEFSTCNDILFFGNETDGTVRLDLNTLSATFNEYFKFKDVFISNKMDILWAKEPLAQDHKNIFRCFDTSNNFEYTQNWVSYFIPLNPATSIKLIYVDYYYNLLYVFYWSGCCATFSIPSTVAEDTELVIKTIRYTYSVDAVYYGIMEEGHKPRLGIKYAYSTSHGVIFDFQHQWDMVAADDPFSAAYAISSDYAGNKLALSYGERNNSFQMREVFLHEVTSDTTSPSPTFILKSSTMSIALATNNICNTAISPNGKLLAIGFVGCEGYSSYQPCLDLVNLTDLSKYNTWVIPNYASSIVFNDDSRFMVCFGGHPFEDRKAHIVAIDDKFNIIYEKLYEQYILTRDIVYGLSLSGRYIIMAMTSYDMITIHDLITKKEHIVNISHIMGVNPTKTTGIPTVSIKPSSLDDTFYIAIDNKLFNLNPKDDSYKLITTFDNKIKIHDISKDGQRIWIIDKDYNLLCLNTENNTHKRIAQSVTHVFETADANHIFYIQNDFYAKKDGYSAWSHSPKRRNNTVTVMFCNTEGEVLEYSLLKNGALSIKCTLTDRGLVISDLDNDLQYFVPSAQHGMNSTVVAKLTQRVDIDNHCMRRASVVCPACAAEFIPTDGPGRYLCPHCHRPIRAI